MYALMVDLLTAVVTFLGFFVCLGALLWLIGRAIRVPDDGIDPEDRAW